MGPKDADYDHAYGCLLHCGQRFLPETVKGDRLEILAHDLPGRRGQENAR